MKFRISTWIIILTVICACSKETVERDQTAPSTVNFTTILTRASAIESPGGLASAGGFHVWAYSHDEAWSTNPTKFSIMDGTLVTKTGETTWSPASPVFWPSIARVSFFAYGPAGSATASGTNTDGVPQITYTTPTDAALQKDVLIAAPVKDKWYVDYSGNKPVDLTFSHALSRIHFSAVYTGTPLAAADKIRIKKVELKNIYSKGTAALTHPISWTELNELASFVVEADKGEIDSLEINQTSQTITLAKGSLFLLPQTIGRSNDTPVMEVTLTIGGKENRYSAPLFSPEKWEPGHTYNYQIAIDGSAIQVIAIDEGISLTDATVGATTMSVALSENGSTDTKRLYTAINTLSKINYDEKTLIGDCTYFGIYATNELTHDITINMKDPEIANLSFTSGEFLIFDFKKTLKLPWGRNAESEPYTVKIINYEDDWALASAFQTAIQTGVDAISGATRSVLPPNGWTPEELTLAQSKLEEPYLWNMIRNRGSIILQKKPIPVKSGQ